MREIFKQYNESKNNTNPKVGKVVKEIMSYIDRNYIRSFTFSELLLSVVKVSFIKELTDEKYFISVAREIIGVDSQVIIERIFYKLKQDGLDRFLLLMDTLIEKKDDIYKLLSIILVRYMICKESYYFKSERLSKEETNFINDLILMNMPVEFTDSGDIISFNDSNYILNFFYIDSTIMFKYLEEFFVSFNYSITSDDYLKQILDIYYEYRNALGGSNVCYTEEKLNHTFFGRFRSISTKELVEKMEYQLTTYKPSIHTQKLKFSNIDLYLDFMGYLWEAYLFKLGDNFHPVLYKLTPVERMYDENIITKEVNINDIPNVTLSLNEISEAGIDKQIKFIKDYLNDTNIKYFTYSELLVALLNAVITVEEVFDRKLFEDSVETILGSFSKVIVDRITYICTTCNSNNLSPAMNEIIKTKTDFNNWMVYILNMFARTRTLHHYHNDELSEKDSTFITDLVLMDMPVKINDDLVIVRCTYNDFIITNYRMDISKSARELGEIIGNISRDTTTSDNFLQDTAFVYYECIKMIAEFGNFENFSNPFESTYVGRRSSESIEDFMFMLQTYLVTCPYKNILLQKFKNLKSYFRYIGYLWEVYLYKLGESFRPNVYTRKGIYIDRCSKSKRYNTPSVTDEENKTTKITITTPENSITINTKQELVDLLNKFVDFLKNEKDN